MVIRGLFALMVLSAVAAATPCAAQSGRGLISTTAARQYGLERMWYAQVDMDRGRGRLAGVAQHVSPTRIQTIFEVVHDNRTYLFSERDLDAYGERIGVDEAKNKAKEKADELIAEAALSKKKTAPPTIISRVVPEITLYASSERGTVHAIDGETGRTRWSVSVGNPDQPTTGPGANDEFVVVLNGSRLFALKATDGTVAFERTVVGGVASAPAVSDALIFVPMISGNVEVYSTEKPNKPMHAYRAHGRTTDQPISSHRSIAWTTESGMLYSANGGQMGLRFRLQMPGIANASPAFMLPDRLLGASEDGHLYCVHEGIGSVQWRVSTGEPINHPPFAVGDTAYAITDRTNLFAIDGTTGREKWVTRGVRGYLAGTGERLYCTDISGNIAILDSRGGGRIGTIPAQNLDLRYHNATTDRLLFGTNGGLLQMFRESGRRWPLVHANVDPTKKPPIEVKQAPAGADVPGDMPAAPPAAADPFDDPFNPKPAAKPQKPAAPMPDGGDPFANDPFGTAPAAPAAAPMPKPAAPPAANDPFKDGGTVRPEDDPFK